MSRVRLSLRALRPGLGVPYYRPEDCSGTIHHVPSRRLIVRLFVLPREVSDRHRPDELPDNWTPEAILDTGASITLFPFLLWQPFREVIQWLVQPPATGARQVTILGGSYSYRLGRVRIGAFDEDANWLPAVWTNALFLDDGPEAPKQAVLGLRTRLFDQRQIRCAHVLNGPLEQEWWLEDPAAPAVNR